MYKLVATVIRCHLSQCNAIYFGLFLFHLYFTLVVFLCRVFGLKIAGLMATYHAKNEYCLLSDMCQGYEVFVSIISQLED